MRKLLMLLGLSLWVSLSWGQKINKDFADGVLLVRLTHYYNIKTGEGKVPNIADKSGNLPFDLINPKTYGIKSFKRAFTSDGGPKLNATMLLEFENHKLIDQLINEIRLSPVVELVEKVPMAEWHLEPNDPEFFSLWHLQKINAPIAWNYFSTGSNVVIAIVDDALQASHPDLAPNIWVNPNEIPGNGIDDDGNGYIDDMNGWDFADNDPDINPNSPSIDHGTHVGGIASAATNNGIGVASIGFSCKLMGLKASNSTGSSFPLINAINGILYAANNGANIVNMSFGTAQTVTSLQDAVNFAQSKGLILVGSAGNNNTDAPNYPAAYAGVISVASSDASDRKSSFSNFGSWVKITAPGSSILSTIPPGTYGTKSGTSMASPMVAGLLGLMKSLNPNIPNAELIQCLYNSADNIDADNPDYVGRLGAGRINAQKAMECVSASLNNPPIADFIATNRTLSAGGITSFLDRSAYGPNSWSWSFPGGTPSSSNLQNPTNIVYNTPGTYSVTLTVTNAFGSNSVTKTGYITVGPAISCQRINLPFPPNWDTVVYTFSQPPGAGFLNGTNRNGDRQRAMFFDVSATNNTTLTGFGVAFSHANSTNPANLNKIINFRILDGTSGSPGAALGVISKTLGELREDVLDNVLTLCDFPNNVSLPPSRRFFVSIDFSNLNWSEIERDSLNIVSNAIGDGGNAVWSQNIFSTWLTYQSQYQIANISLFIFPFLTPTPTKAVISPQNPSICTGNAVAFTAENSIMPPNRPLQWALLGTTPQIIENQININPVYNSVGSFKAYLGILGACNELRIDSTVVTVNASPTVNVTASKNPICIGETAALSATGATSYSWSPASGLNTTTGASVQASPTTTTNYLITGTTGTCSSFLTFELVVNGNTANVLLEASEIAITQPTNVTFTAIPSNGGSAPTFNFRVNGISVQNGPQNFITRLVNVGDKVQCTMTSSEPCVIEKSVTSNEINMGNPLPVTLLRFTGRRTPAGNLLEWTTGIEINSKEFVLERSADGTNFGTIDRVNAAGNSVVQTNYSLLDSKFGIGKNFYRLKMVDLDGTFKYSRIVLIENGPGVLTTTLAPNPARTGSNSTLTLTGIERDTRVSITVINAAGATLKSYQVQSFNGTVQVALPAGNLPSGSYMILVRDVSGNINETVRWNVMR
jgi:serine protease